MKPFLLHLWHRIRVFLFIFLALLTGIGCYFVLGSYSEGYRAGTVIKFSKKGVVFKTYEGELNLGLVITDNAAANFGSNLFEFSVPSGNTNVISELERVMLTGQRVKVFYKQKFVSFPWVGDQKYHIYGVEAMETNRTQE